MINFDKFKSPLKNVIKKNLLTKREVNSLWDNYQKIEKRHQTSFHRSNYYRYTLIKVYFRLVKMVI